MQSVDHLRVEQYLTLGKNPGPPTPLNHGILYFGTDGKLYVGQGAAAVQVSDLSAASAATLGALISNLLTGAAVGNVATGNVLGGIPVVHEILIAAGANGNTDVVLTNKTRVLDCHLILLGAGVASETLQLFNGANAITGTLAASGSANAIVRATTIDSARYEVAAGGTLRVTSAGGASQPDALVVVTGVRVA